MMKRTVAFFTAMMLCISLSACGADDSKRNSPDDAVLYPAETDETDTTTTVVTTTTTAATVTNAPTAAPTMATRATFVEMPTTKTTRTTTTTKRKTTTTTKKQSHTHSYSAATCEKPATCSCGATKGSALGHRYENGVCKTCGKVDSSYTIQYTVNYEANGGWGETVSSTHKYNEARALSKNGFKRAGYSFAGWSTNAKATDATYTDKQSVKNLASKNNQTVTLYAVWKESRTSSFEDCLKTNASGSFKYHQDAMDNLGQAHTNVVLLSDGGSGNSEERFVVGLFSRISGTLYLREDEDTAGSEVYIKIYGDGELLYKSDVFTNYSPSQTFDVDISGINVLEINEIHSGYSWNWAGNLFIENLTLTR